jgi:hypothetical protein
VSATEDPNFFAEWAARRLRLIRALVTWLGALLAHGLVALLLTSGDDQPALAPAPQPAREWLQDAAAATKQLLAKHRHQEARRRLVAEARAARRRHSLALGEFLLRANAIDAEEEGSPFDLNQAKRLFIERVTWLKSELATTNPATAISKVFADLAYTGVPGGRLSDVLLNRSGSCEPLSHLLVAALHDVGLGSRAFLRYYGGKSAGVSHLAPLLADLTAEGRLVQVRDLVSGQESAPSGAYFPAADLIDVYARAHDLEQNPIPRDDFDVGSQLSSSPTNLDGGPFSLQSVPATQTLSSGYPANNDRFEGALPLYSERAIANAEAADESSARAGASVPCAFYLHMAWIDPPHVRTGQGGDVNVELVRLPSGTSLDRLATLIQSVEAEKSPTTLAGRLAQSACLKGLYGRAGLLFSLAGKRTVSQRALHAEGQARHLGELALAELAQLSAQDQLEVLQEMDDLTFGRVWALIFLPGSTTPLLHFVTANRGNFRRVLPLAALLINPASRDLAAEVTDALPVDSWLDVMAELAHAHDNSRPWTAIHPLGAEEDAQPVSRFLSAYRVFARMSWRMWEAARSPEEVVLAIATEAKRYQLADAERDAIGHYYLRQFTLLESNREGGPARIRRAAAALRANGFTSSNVPQ